MDNDILMMVIKLVIIMPVMIGLLYFILKYSSSKIQAASKNKIVNIIEKTPITKNSYIMVVKITYEYYVVYITGDKSKILMKLDKEKVEAIKQNTMQPENSPEQMDYINVLKSFMKKRKEKNEDK